MKRKLFVEDISDDSFLQFISSSFCQYMDEYVHFNVGWEGTSDGWYKSGVFDMLNGYTNDDQRIVRKGQSSNDNDYSKAVKIWTNIHPKY